MKKYTAIVIVSLLATICTAGGVQAAKNKKVKNGSSDSDVSTVESINNSIDLKFVKVSAGSFIMGDRCKKTDDPFISNDEYDKCMDESSPRERPRHRVVIRHAFWIGQFEVTQEQWYNVMGYNPAKFKSDKVGEDSRNFPVESVSWDDVQEFIARLSAKDGKQYRLPTEAEWEFACRSGGKDQKFCGGNDLSGLAWYDANSDKRTHRVGSKKPNLLGLYDMSGNVREWVSDWYGADYYGASPENDPKGPLGGSARVNRGGAWRFEESSARATTRIDHSPDTRYDFLGFRLALSAQ